MCRPYHHPPVWLQAWVRRPALMGNTPPPATPTSLWSERSASQSAAVQPETPAASVSHRVGVFFQYVWVYESRGLVVSLFNRLAFNNNNNKVIISSSPSANETVFFSMVRLTFSSGVSVTHSYPVRDEVVEPQAISKGIFLPTTPRIVNLWKLEGWETQGGRSINTETQRHKKTKELVKLL